MKKKLLILGIIISALALCFCMTGCASPTPTDTVKSFLEAVKANDSDTVAKYYAVDDSSLLDTSVTTASEDASDAQKSLVDKMTTKYRDFDYTIGEESIDGDTATVEVTFTTYNFGGALVNAYSKFISNIFAFAFSGASQSQITDLFYANLETELDNLTEKNLSNTTTLSLTKKDGTWIVDQLSDEAEDDLSGNLISKANSLSTSLSNS